MRLFPAQSLIAANFGHEIISRFTPAIDGTTIFKGQSVRAVSSSGMMSGGGMGGMMGGGTIAASEVDLEEQGLSGTVSGYSGAAAPTTFTLTLPSDSASATLTGATTITVFQQVGTELRGMTTITNGNTVHVRGLQFFDAGTYKLVASRIMARRRGTTALFVLRTSCI